MDILYVGTLPPHPGGSAVVGGQLAAGLAERGHRVRALAPMTPAASATSDRFAARHPAVAITRYLVPDFQVVGWVDHGEIPGYLRLADIVVMPSAFEALPLVYLETQASARVLIASDIPAAREVVDVGVDGLLFPLADVDALASHKLEAAGDPALRASIGAAARQRAKGHPLPQVLDRYASLLAEIA